MTGPYTTVASTGTFLRTSYIEQSMQNVYIREYSWEPASAKTYIYRCTHQRVKLKIVFYIHAFCHWSITEFPQKSTTFRNVSWRFVKKILKSSFAPVSPQTYISSKMDREKQCWLLTSVENSLYMWDSQSNPSCTCQAWLPLERLEMWPCPDVWWHSTCRSKEVCT